MLRSLTLTAAITVALGAVACSTLNAATLRVQGYSTTNGLVGSLYLHGGADNNHFDSIDVLITPARGHSFVNPTSGFAGGAPRPPGDPFTYANRALGVDPVDFPGVGLGWTILGLTQTADKVAFGGGPLGLKIETSGQPGGEVFLANAMVTLGGLIHIRVQLISAGEIIADLKTFAFPEPASHLLAGAALAGIAAIRRPRS